MRALALLLAAAAPAAAPVVGGVWLTPDRDALVTIAPCGPSLCGRISRVLKASSRPTTDVKNPDPALRARPLAEVPILAGFAYADGRWQGRIYDPRSGRTYRGELIRRGDTLDVKGCLGPFCRTQHWTQSR